MGTTEETRDQDDVTENNEINFVEIHKKDDIEELIEYEEMLQKKRDNFCHNMNVIYGFPLSKDLDHSKFEKINNELKEIDENLKRTRDKVCAKLNTTTYVRQYGRIYKNWEAQKLKEEAQERFDNGVKVVKNVLLYFVIFVLMCSAVVTAIELNNVKEAIVNIESNGK